MISQEECELIVSFKNQLEEKVKIYNEKQKEIEKQEKEVIALTNKIAKNQILVEEYQKTLSSLRKQIIHEREQLRTEETARHNQILKNNRISASFPCILLCSVVLETKKTPN